MDIKEFAFLRKMARTDHFTEKEYEIIDKMEAKMAREMYLEMCKEEKICPVCGEGLVGGGMVVGVGTGYEKVRATVCAQQSCGYNKEVAKELEEENRYKNNRTITSVKLV